MCPRLSSEDTQLCNIFDQVLTSREERAWVPHPGLGKLGPLGEKEEFTFRSCRPVHCASWDAEA